MSIPNLQGTSLYLIGMMGSGKTTIGQLLADRLSYQFFDTDGLIETITQQSVTQIFETSGEAGFRQVETQVLSELSSYGRKLISTGGGIVTMPENWGHLRTGVIVWLDVPVPVLCDRLALDTSRPILQAGNEDLSTKLQTLLEARSKLYAQADLHIEIAAEETPEVICDRLLRELTIACQAKADEKQQTLQLNREKPFQAH
jgi:shikimate kinase